MDFCPDQVIGELILDMDKLPLMPNFLFSIGYKIDSKTGKYDLLCISPIPDFGPLAQR